MKKKRGQIQINFSMIFSILLIAVFIAVAFYAISMFLDIKNCSDTGLFKQDLQESIDKALNSDLSQFNFTSNLPNSIKQVCIIDMGSAAKGQFSSYYKDIEKYGWQDFNLFFYPFESACSGQTSFNLEHLNIEEITKNENPYCFDNSNKITMRIEKGFGDNLVTLKRT